MATASPSASRAARTRSHAALRAARAGRFSSEVLLARRFSSTRRCRLLFNLLIASLCGELGCRWSRCRPTSTKSCSRYGGRVSCSRSCRCCAAARCTTPRWPTELRKVALGHHFAYAVEVTAAELVYEGGSAAFRPCPISMQGRHPSGRCLTAGEGICAFAPPRGHCDVSEERPADAQGDAASGSKRCGRLEREDSSAVRRMERAGWTATARGTAAGSNRRKG